MAELDRPTESEIEAGDVLYQGLVNLTGDEGRAAYHVQAVRRECERRGRTSFMDYLFVLAGEIPKLVVDPTYRAGAYALQQQIDLAKMTLDEDTLRQITDEEQGR